ncbi:hypothetical protein GCM10009664_63470 [Kitasatospora gansuensis]
MVVHVQAEQRMVGAGEEAGVDAQHVLVEVQGLAEGVEERPGDPIVCGRLRWARLGAEAGSRGTAGDAVRAFWKNPGGPSTPLELK